MTYYVLGMGPTQPGAFHIWGDENVDWIEPTASDHAPDHGEPVGPAMCGAEEYAAVLDQMSDRADSLKEYLRRADDEVCPECAQAVEERHGLPADEYRTTKLDARIKSARAGRKAQSIRDEMDDLAHTARSHGVDYSEMTFTVSTDIMDELRSDARMVSSDGGEEGSTEYMGTPVLESDVITDVKLTTDTDSLLSVDWGPTPSDTSGRPSDEDEPDVAVVSERLTNISGVSPARAEALYDAGYYDLDDIREASLSDLTEVEGVGNALAARIKAEVAQ